jgi:hypothetical protein
LNTVSKNKKDLCVYVLASILLVLGLFLVERFAFITIDTNYDLFSKIAHEKRELRGKLIDYELVNKISSKDINKLFPENDEIQGDISKLPTFDIDLYRISYTSVFLDEIVILSGLIIVPNKDGPIRHLQYHHGTLLPYPYVNGEGSLDAPSLYSGGYPQTKNAHYETRLFGNYLGSAGFLVSMPDYIGYGVSSGYEHPYSVNDRLAEQSVDMLIATQSFAEKLKLEVTDELYLSGWSEGAAASLATQKLIENGATDTDDSSYEISISANFALAGFYNTELYSKLFLGLSPLDYSDWGGDLDVLLWALYAINAYTDDQPLDISSFLKIPAKNQLDVLKNRTTSTPAEIYRYFIADKTSLLSKFAKNDLSAGWAPKARLYIHHGTADDIVYYPFNAELTAENLYDEGGLTTLVRYDGHDHYSPAKLFLLDMIREIGE